MSLHDSLYVSLYENNDEIYEEKYINICKEFEDIDNLIYKIKLHETNIISNKKINLINCYIFLIFYFNDFINNCDYQQKCLVDLKKCYFNKNIYYEYLSFIDFYVKINILFLINDIYF